MQKYRKTEIWLLATLVVSSALYAQETTLGKAEVLEAFRKYNPAALEKATTVQAYGQILNKLAEDYSAPATEEQKYELIGLVKNFDNSLRLQWVRENYFNSRTLQEMSGLSLNALEEQTRNELKKVVQALFDVTMEVKQLQLADYKQQFKETHNAQFKTQVKQLKQEIRQLKQNSKQKIQATADAYLKQLAADYQAKQSQQLQAEQSANRDIKANHKKPVAE